jgi:hypothetical protein
MSKQLLLTLVLAAGTFAALLSSPVAAQQKHSIVISGEGVKGRYVQQLFVDVDDVPGHQVRVQESQRIYPSDNQPLVDGERIVESWGRGFSNYTAGVGPSWGYSTWITDKGNKIFSEYWGSSETTTTETGSKRGTYHGTSRLVGGTGRFAKIRGVLVDVTEFDTDMKVGYQRGTSRGEYWFEQ